MTLKTHRKAFTLIELIISMTILATIAAIAVISVDDMGETSRYDETDRRGKVIQNAVAGYDTPRFIQDMGRMPVVLVNYDQNDDDDVENRQKLALAELIDLEADSTLLYTYENAQRVKKQECSISIDLTNITSASSGLDVSDTDFPTTVTIKAGWAGPYALSGSENMTDNWGKAWDIYHYGDDGVNVDSDTEDVLKWATKLTGEDWADTNDEISSDTDEYTEIYGIRSIYSEDYASDLSYKFPENSVYADDVTIKLLDSKGATIEAEDYPEIRVFLYLPYCEPRSEDKSNENAPYPRVIELCLWANYDDTSDTTSGMRIRYDTFGTSSTSSTPPSTYAVSYTTATGFTYPTYLKARFDDSATSFNNFALNSVPVGSRKIWAYAKISSNSTSSGIYAPLQNVKITATNNVIELRLTETF